MVSDIQRSALKAGIRIETNGSITGGMSGVREATQSGSATIGLIAGIQADLFAS